jgi:hypothetical protein
MAATTGQGNALALPRGTVVFEDLTMWEITLFDDGVEVGTWDYPSAPTVGTDYGDCVVIGIREIDAECMMASVDIAYR